MFLAWSKRVAALLLPLALVACGGGGGGGSAPVPNPVNQSLSVTLDGAGSVSSNPSGIQCPGDCGEVMAQGAAVTLTATPAAGQVFAGWSGGACSGQDGAAGRTGGVHGSLLGTARTI